MEHAIDSGPPRGLLLAVAAMSGALLLQELLLTRVFSVLFFYHYSFFSISLAMAGLAAGGLVASRWPVRAERAGEASARLARLARMAGAGMAGAALFAAHAPWLARYWAPDTVSRISPPSLAAALGVALAFLPGLIAAGAFLATAFALRERWIGRLYAADLAAAAAAGLASLVLMRALPGASALFAAAALACAASPLAASDRAQRRRGLAALGFAALLIAQALASRPPNGALGEPERFGEVVWERWNEHSRIAIVPERDPIPHYYAVIDKAAATRLMPTRPRAAGAPPPVEPWWGQSVSHFAYQLGRPIERAAIIGVGGGSDLLAPLAAGARQVDGFELNGLFLELLRDDAPPFSDLARWPEISLVHSEARVALRQRPDTYDSIQATMIDTWASTASGSLVLAENGLYTVEGWLAFLDALKPAGLLTLTRWYLPAAPAEIERLVSLAAEALTRRGAADPRAQILLVARNTWGAIVVSKTPFSQGELARAEAVARERETELLALPGRTPRDPVIDALLDPARRGAAIAQSRFDLSPPTDERPYFFLQLRPRDFMRYVAARPEHPIFEITFRSVSLLLLLAGLSLALAAGVVLLALRLHRAAPGAAQTARYRWLTLYFCGIGVGYMLVQLALHQRLTLVLGHPTAALASVLVAMLVGSGIGAELSQRVAVARAPRVLAAIVALLALAALALPVAGELSGIASPLARAVACAAVVGAVGLPLGMALPLGVRLAEATGAGAVQRLWAVNGAASIAATSFAALLGLSFGSRAVLAAGCACYVAAALAALRARAGAAR